MTCIYLVHKEHKPLCHVSLSQLTPELSDLVNHCESENHSNCPITVILAKEV